MWANIDKNIPNKHHQRAFTIVELLIVIVVIGILAAISIVTYNGIQQRAMTASLQSDLTGSSKLLAIDQINNSAYPATIAEANGGRGLNPSSGNNYSYVVNTTTSPQSYCLSESNGTTGYFTTSTSNVPTVGDCTTSYGLAGWWPMNGTANDTSGNNMNGIVSGASLVTGQNGKANGAYLFNGTSNYIGFADTTPVNFVSNDFTVSAWIKLTTLPTTAAWDDLFSSSGLGDWSVGISVNSSGVGYLRMTKISQIDAPLSTAPVTQNTWHFVSVNFSYASPTATVSYYLDGNLNGSSNWNYSGTGAFTPQTKLIGTRQYGSGYFHGSIDDVRIYNRLLGSGEIASLYGKGAQ